MAEERAKPDAERKPAFQERNWENHRQREQSRQFSYRRGVHQELMKFFWAVAQSYEGAKEWTSLLDPNTLDYSKTQLESVDERIRLLKEATPDDLKASSDVFIQFALQIHPLLQKLEKDGFAQAGEYALAYPKYIRALRAFQAGLLAPDANSSLRVTYGQIKGYTSAETGQFYAPFTNASQMVDKTVIHKNTSPFEAPPELIHAIRERNYGIYADSFYGDLPLNFLANIDITGGNSGSATVDRNGHLVGLAFDANSQSLHDDWQFAEDSRAIIVDTRFILWLTDRYYGFRRLLDEMTLVDPPCKDLL
jgi:hypothetical protein